MTDKIFDTQEFSIQNDRLALKFLPEYGCYWTDLIYKHYDTWVDVLVPIPDQKELLREPFGSYLMCPWANRIENASFSFSGKNFNLKPSFPDGTAIHGDMRHRSWNILKATEEQFEASFDTRHSEDFNYPFDLKVIQSMELRENQLQIALYMQNVGNEDAPVGFGYHPFFKRKLTERDEDVVLLMKANKIFPCENQLPIAPAKPVKGKNDFRTPHFLGDPDLDHCFSDITENKIDLIYQGTGLKVTMEFDPIFQNVVVYAPNENGTPRNFVAVEPQTHIINALNLSEKAWGNTGVQILKPGQTWGGTLQFSFTSI